MSGPHAKDPGTGYVPTLSEEQVGRIRSWHERAYSEARAKATSAQAFEYLGLSLVVPPEVMPIAGVSHLLGNAVLAEATSRDKVLDMGTGSGVNAILAASKGAHVLAVDVNPHALAAAKENAERNGVSALVEVRRSDVFSAVVERFDLILFDPPYRWFPARDWLEGAMTDENYGAMTRFFRAARQHLEPGGRMLISFGTSGDIEYLRGLISEEGFSLQVVAHDELLRDERKVEYFTFLVR